MTWLPDETLDHLRKVSTAPDLSGTKYRILRELGRGGMATVYLAHDSELNREVAMKVLDFPDFSAELASRMLREAAIVARLEHPGIVPIHDVGLLPDDRVFYVMKYVRGERLDSFIHKTLPERLRVFQRICEAVAFAHAEGVIHRDLKPENIMVGAFGEVLVMDWGLAKLLRDPETKEKTNTGENRPGTTGHGTVLGTPSYMAPEQAAGEIGKLDERTDVYSLGAILYFLLTGVAPPEEGISSARFEPPRKRNPKIAAAINAVCIHAMAPDQSSRYANAMDLSQDVARFLDDLPVSVYKENFYEKSVRWASRNYFFILLVLAYLLMRVVLILIAGR
ncbi:serine/threonine protein kinase [bacterium]|nr:serine/threonine protein kinase [bacterium]